MVNIQLLQRFGFKYLS